MQPAMMYCRKGALHLSMSDSAALAKLSLRALTDKQGSVTTTRKHRQAACETLRLIVTPLPNATICSRQVGNKRIPRNNKARGH